MSYSNHLDLNLIKLTKNLRAFTKKGKQMAYEQMEKEAKELEKYMKANAPWQDRTGDARENLNTKVEQKGQKITIILSNPMYYGYYLEQKMGKRFAIIDPTIKAKSGEVMDSLKGLFK